MLWVLAPRNTALEVFTGFTDGGGWSSMGLALMVGQISAIYACICSDAAAHMSEEIKVCNYSEQLTRTLGTRLIFHYRMLAVLSLARWSTPTFSVVPSLLSS